MRNVADYHMHTPLCRHAAGEPVEYAAKALKAGLPEIGFSDHSPMPKDGFDDWRMLASQLDEYVEKVQTARRTHPALSIKLALEVDFIPGYEDWIRELAAKHPWDYFIGSVHYVSGHWDVDNPYRLAEWKNRDTFQVWSEYFERLTQAAHSGLFEIIGHCDLPKKFKHIPTQDISPLYRRFLETAAQKDVAIELNTAGLRKDCKEIYPSRRILEEAHRLGVKITFGSDAHSPEEVGADFDQAIQLATTVGYSEACRFEKRHRSLVRF